MAVSAQSAPIPYFSKVATTQIIYELRPDDNKESEGIIRAYLSITYNGDSSFIAWHSYTSGNIIAELYRDDGKPAEHPPTAMSILSGEAVYSIPFGSSLKWLISDKGGVGYGADAAGKYVLVIDSNVWLIPKDKAGRYTLKVIVQGIPNNMYRSNLNYSDQRNRAIPLFEAKSNLEINK